MESMRMHIGSQRKNIHFTPRKLLHLGPATGMIGFLVLIPPFIPFCQDTFPPINITLIPRDDSEPDNRF
jgi:hypothetical protein